MGNCLRVHTKPDSSLKLKWWIGSNTANAPVQIGENVDNSVNTIGNEELFFDSKPWLDSDNDDFFSVNGDATPSRCNTPILHISSTIHPGSVAGPSPTDAKKQLIELFRESFNDNPVNSNQGFQGAPEAKPSIFQLPSKSTNKSPASNFTSDCETTPNESSRPVEEKSARPVQCCFPRLTRGQSFSEKKRASLGYGHGE